MGKALERGDLFIACFFSVWHCVLESFQHYNNSYNKCALLVKLCFSTSDITGELIQPQTIT